MYFRVSVEHHLGGKVCFNRFASSEIVDQPELWHVPSQEQAILKATKAISKYRAGDYNVEFPSLPFIPLFEGYDDTPMISAVVYDRKTSTGMLEVMERYVRWRCNLNKLKHDDAVTGLMALTKTPNGWQTRICKDRWSDGRATMDAGDLPIIQTQNDPEWVARFVRDAQRASVYEPQDINVDLGRCPEFSSEFWKYRLGVCSLIWLPRDKVFIFVRRGRAVQGLNVGRGFAASGAVDWDHVRGNDLNAILRSAMEQEAREEIANIDWEIIPIGAARELTRQGSPEFFFLLQSEMSTTELVAAMGKNTHAEAEEVDGLIYSCTWASAQTLLDNPDAGIIHQKGLLNLALAAKYLSKA